VLIRSDTPTTAVVLAMIVGTPLGIALGRLAWTFFASNYSVVGVVVVPWWQGAIIIAGSLVVVTALETATDVV
jgi:hypothetical protein